MPYYDRKPKKSFSWGKFLGVTAASIVCLGVIAWYALPFLYKVRSAQLASEVDAAAVHDKAVGPLLLQMKRDFPEDYAEFRRQASNPLAPSVAGEKLRVTFLAYSSHFMGRHFDDAEVAPAENLKQLRETYLNLLVTFQAQSPEQCVGYLGGTLPTTTKFTPAITTAILQMKSAELDAVAAGQRQPSDHGGMTADAEMALAHLVDKTRGAEAQPNAAAPPKPVQPACATEVAIQERINALPPVLADKITADMMRESYQPYVARSH